MLAHMCTHIHTYNYTHHTHMYIYACIHTQETIMYSGNNLSYLTPDVVRLLCGKTIGDYDLKNGNTILVSKFA